MKKLLNIITEGKYQKFKTVFTATVCVYITFIVLMVVLFANTNPENIFKWYFPLNSILGWALIIEVLYYFMKFSQLKRSIKLAVIDGSLVHIHEITEKKFHSYRGIAFSNYFFYDLKNNFFITYDSIVWVYRKGAGMVIRTINGKKFNTKINNTDLRALLTANPRIMNGYNSDNYKKYNAMVKAFKPNDTLDVETIVFHIP